MERRTFLANMAALLGGTVLSSVGIPITDPIHTLPVIVVPKGTFRKFDIILYGGESFYFTGDVLVNVTTSEKITIIEDDTVNKRSSDLKIIHSAGVSEYYDTKFQAT